MKIHQHNSLTGKTEVVKLPKSKLSITDWITKFQEKAPKHITYSE